MWFCSKHKHENWYQDYLLYLQTVNNKAFLVVHGLSLEKFNGKLVGKELELPGGSGTHL